MASKKNYLTLPTIMVVCWLVVATIAAYRDLSSSYSIIWILILIFCYLTITFEYMGYSNPKIFQLGGCGLLVSSWIIYITYPPGKDIFSLGFLVFFTLYLPYLAYKQSKDRKKIQKELGKHNEPTEYYN